MKQLLIICFIGIMITSCTNREFSQDRQDSIEAASAADSMLEDATKEDTTNIDKVAVDTSDRDNL
ncbi:MAG TPA: hypothetical protein VGD31_07320 [Sphingobacteriaceae bacterium]